jgi:hypothetical protein
VVAEVEIAVRHRRHVEPALPQAAAVRRRTEQTRVLLQLQVVDGRVGQPVVEQLPGGPGVGCTKDTNVGPYVEMCRVNGIDGE